MIVVSPHFSGVGGEKINVATLGYGTILLFERIFRVRVPTSDGIQVDSVSANAFYSTER